MEITAGVPQGSILSPTLECNIQLKLPISVEIVGFANDIVLTVTRETAEEVEMLATEAIETVEDWMCGVWYNKLQVAQHKTELVLISNCKTVQQIQPMVGESSVNSKRALRHLSVMIDDRLNFNSHVGYVCEKASKVITAVARIIPNNSGPRSSKRPLLANVSTSTLRYGAAA